MIRKLMLDAEFARRLQAVDDEGQDTDQVKDAERCVKSQKTNYFNLISVACLGEISWIRSWWVEIAYPILVCNKQFFRRPLT